jgi:hypothetical protein
MLQSTREELAWAGGFYDGEGCMSVRKDNTHVRVQLGQANLEVLQKFQRILGVGYISGPYRQRQTEAFWMWQALGYEELQAAVALLWDFVSTPKREQIMRTLPNDRRRLAVGRRFPRAGGRTERRRRDEAS